MLHESIVVGLAKSEIWRDDETDKDNAKEEKLPTSKHLREIGPTRKN
jgi:hypothetical protein